MLLSSPHYLHEPKKVPQWSRRKSRIRDFRVDCTLFDGEPRVWHKGFLRDEYFSFRMLFQSFSNSAFNSIRRTPFSISSDCCRQYKGWSSAIRFMLWIGGLIVHAVIVTVPFHDDDVSLAIWVWRGHQHYFGRYSFIWGSSNCDGGGEPPEVERTVEGKFINIIIWCVAMWCKIKMRADEMNIILLLLPPLLLRFKRRLIVISSRRGDDTAPPQSMVGGLFSVLARVFCGYCWRRQTRQRYSWKEEQAKAT